MSFIKTHKAGVAVGVGAVAIAVVGGVLIWKYGGRSDKNSGGESGECAPPARFSTGGERYGYGSSNDMDGETYLIKGFDSAMKAVPIGEFHTTWGANAASSLLVVDSPDRTDNGGPGTDAECAVINIPLDGWEDSAVKGLCVDINQKLSAKLPGGENVCLRVSNAYKDGTVSLMVQLDSAALFPAKFTLPAMNIKLVPKTEQEML